MLIYLILIIIFGVVILISVATLIYGLFKKRKNLLITAVILFIIGTIGCAFSALTYTKKVVNYVRSNEFQNDTKKGSELIGQTIGSASSGVSRGLATTLDDEATTRLASKTATIIGKSIKTVASSFDSTVGNRNIFLDSSLSDSGLGLGRAEEKYNLKNDELEIFIDYKKPL
jgi:ABC-type transport system involved in multi-copper enzyme maturation permease subunit